MSEAELLAAAGYVRSVGHVREIYSHRETWLEAEIGRSKSAWAFRPKGEVGMLSCVLLSAADAADSSAKRLEEEAAKLRRKAMQIKAALAQRG